MTSLFENFHFLGGKKSKKQRKREVLEYNYTKGKIGEDLVAMKYTLMGYEVERTGRVIESKVIEVKTGRSKLSKLQKKMKKKKSNYRVEKVDPLFY